MLAELKNFSQNGIENLHRNEECLRDLKDVIGRMTNQRSIIINELNTVKPRLKNLIRKRIDELVQFIFPINEIQTTKR